MTWVSAHSTTGLKSLTCTPDLFVIQIPTLFLIPSNSIKTEDNEDSVSFQSQEEESSEDSASFQSHEEEVQSHEEEVKPQNQKKAPRLFLSHLSEEDLVYDKSQAKNE